MLSLMRSCAHVELVSGFPCEIAVRLKVCNGRSDMCCLLHRVILPAYGAGPYLPAIVMERPVYVREMSDGLYSPLTYLMYKVRPHFCPILLQEAF